ncbi:MAG: porin family protein [Rhodospirillales bacterium]|nr:porin family protein [Rhodospirillales bacterium]
MKRFLWIIATFTCLAASLPAQAQRLAPGQDFKKSLYVSGAFGLSIPNTADWNETPNLNGDIEYEKTTSFSGALGIKLSPYFSADTEFSYRNSSLDELTVNGVGSAELNGDSKMWAGLVNLYLHMMPKSDFSPYFMVGAGAARYSIDIDAIGGLGVTGASGTDTVAAYQWGAGVNYNVSDDGQIWLGYRFLGTDRPVISTTEIDYTAHEIMLGYRHHFQVFGE